jgi:NADPH2:quinone reductase
MRAIVVDRLTREPERLQVSEWATPTAGPGEVLIDVRAAGCNFSDVLMLSGTYQVKPELPFVLGREAAGVISALGEGARGLSLGDRVLAFTDLGAFAERVAVAAADVRIMPETMSFEAGAAIPIVYSTSYAALVDRAALQAGETLLVHAAAGGVGLAAVQIGKALGARIIATAGAAPTSSTTRWAVIPASDLSSASPGRGDSS